MSPEEAFYDAEIAPVLLALCKKCQDRGLGFLAMVQYDPDGSVGRTVSLPANASAVLRYANALGQAQTAGGVNIDGFMFAVMREARETGHSSMVLMQLGVPLTPPAPPAQEAGDA